MDWGFVLGEPTIRVADTRYAEKLQTCQRKVKHETYQKALAEATRMKMSFRARGAERILIFGCVVCGGWHLGKRRDTH